MFKNIKFFTSLAISILIAISGYSKNQPYKKDILLMDTIVHFEIRDFLPAPFEKDIIEQAIDRMKDLEKRFNYYAKDSELSKINNLKSGKALVLSDEMFEVLSMSREGSTRTEGAFDVTIAPLYELWFSAGGKGIFPDEEKIAMAKELAGGGNWVLDEGKKTITLKRDGVKITLGAVAKGFIVDEGIKVLKEAGVKNALINAGGDMYCLGEGSKDGWRVGVRDPMDREKVTARFNARNKGVATSGGYERFIDFGGKRFSHIIDPRTGRARENVLQSVTVLAETCAKADIFATAVYVIGPEKGLSLIENTKGVDCIIVDESGRIYLSSGIKGGV